MGGENPIIQNRAVPVFIDVQLGTYVPDPSLLESALSARTKAIIFAHTLGNPFDLETVSAFARKHGLWLIEDCCDALGSTFQGKNVGTFGDIATYRFIQHITLRWARADVLPLRALSWQSSSNPSATGAVIAVVRLEKTTLAARDTNGNLGSYLAGMTMSTLNLISGTTSN